jgi:hypothetical protein
MGDNFLLAQARNFKKGQDRGMNRLGQRSLFDRPELVQSVYPVAEINGYSIKVGDELLALPSRTEGRVDVALGNRHVGVSKGEAAKALRAALAGPNGLGGAKVVVVAKSELSGVAQVRIKGSEGAA